MPDREKYIVILSKAAKTVKELNEDTPINISLECIEDILELLKEQEPRVMTLEEVLAMKFDDVVYVEVVPTHTVLSAIVLDVIPKLPEIGIGVVQFRQAPTWNGINNADLSYYSKTWRCWTSRPTDEQRKAVKWE
jgi:hypothetical protein